MDWIDSKDRTATVLLGSIVPEKGRGEWVENGRVLDDGKGLKYNTQDNRISPFRPAPKSESIPKSQAESSRHEQNMRTEFEPEWRTPRMEQQ